MTQQKPELLAQGTEKHSQNKKNKIDECFAVGAEAKLLLEDNYVIKDRISKSYRHPQLDKKIIKQRTKSEAKILEKASKLIPIPKSEIIAENKIKLDYIKGKKLSENLEQLDWKNICKKIGNQIALLHDNNIIHGDLTTSNMILVDNFKEKLDKGTELEQDLQLNKIKNNKQLSSKSLSIINKHNKASNRTCAGCEQIEQSEQISSEQKASENPNNKKLFFIDFGLSFISNRIEDKAVDLHLIKQALEAKHFTIHKQAEQIILENYNSKDKDKILEQLKKVESRGRYKH